MDIRVIRIAGVCLLAVVALSAAGAAVDGYSISGSDAIETPTQTVTYEGQEYTIDSVSRITAGGSVTITTSVPTDASYKINLRSPENQLISSEQKTGDATHTLSYFGPEDEAGTYAATIEDNGNTVAVYPIVIAGYDVSVPSPDSVEAGEEATISATVTERSVEKHSSLDRVEVVVGNDDVEVQQSMTQVDDETYETTVSTDELDAETYNVYVVVRGNETVRQRAEILGVSDTVELTVTEATTPTSDDGGTGGVGGGGDTSTPDERTPTPTPQSTATPTPGETATDVGETETSQPPATDSAPTTSTETATDGGSENVIAPSTQGDTSTTDGSGPGFTVGVAVLAVLAALAIGRRR